jgi:hypothetical protein
MTNSPKLASYHDIPGWFYWDDRAAFDAILSFQNDRAPGVLVELGCYQGKSTVIIADHRRPGERLVVVDLFGSEVGLSDDDEGAANRREVVSTYKTLTREKFEANFLAFHSELPEIVHGLSTEIVKHVEPGTVRFAHIDASHMYPQVAEDIANVRKLLAPGGVVALDDFRTEHTPGVSAAVWEAVIRDGMIPFALTRKKMFAVWDDPQPYVDMFRQAVGTDSRLGYEEHVVMGHHIIRVKVPAAPPPARPPKLTGEEIDAVAARVAKRLRPAVNTEVRRGLAKYLAAAQKRKTPAATARALVKETLPAPVVDYLRRRRRSWR